MRLFEIDQIVQSESLAEEFTSFMKEHGWGKVKVSREDFKIFEASFEQMKLFYKRSDKSDVSQKYDSRTEIGYSYDEKLGKEFFAVC